MTTSTVTTTTTTKYGWLPLPLMLTVLNALLYLNESAMTLHDLDMPILGPKYTETCIDDVVSDEAGQSGDNTTEERTDVPSPSHSSG